jgi:molecular chaperone DnaJ
MSTDLYELLGVTREASEAEVRRAYQKRARALHPHLNPGDPDADERFEAVTAAFRVLSDPDRRAAYDRGERPETRLPTSPGSFEGFDFSAEVRVERVGFREIFDTVLQPASVTGASRGEDVRERTRLRFEESFRGTERRIQVERYESCPTCRGSGDVAAASTACAKCQGTGQVRGRRGHMIFSRRCAACDGAGVLRRRSCPGCAGEGRVPGSERLDVSVPPGARSGSTVRLAGCGHAGRRGGPPGDLVLEIEVDEHPHFRREGDDLRCVVPVSIVEAALGGHVEVETPDGVVTIEVPAGTQHGQRFRLRKRGLPRLGQTGRGDLYAEVRVIVPTVTDDRGRALLRAFSEAHPQDRAALREALEAGEVRA